MSLLRVAMFVALASQTFANSPQTSSPRASVSVGADISNTDSHRAYATGSLDLDDRWTVDAAVARADLEMPEAETQSTLASINLSYDIHGLSVGAGYRHSEIDGVSRSDDWLVRGSYRFDELRFGLEVGKRDSTLAPSSFTEDLGAGTGVVSGISRCRVNGLGYRGSADLDRPTWSGFATLRVFDYDDYDCTLEISGGGPTGNPLPARARGRALGRRLAAATLDDVIGVTSRLAPREAALLESSASIGFTTPVTARWIAGLELSRDVEKLDGSEYLTGTVTASTQLHRDWTLELSLGYSMADDIDDSAFAGVRVITYFLR
jgi:hypothetical protein